MGTTEKLIEQAIAGGYRIDGRELGVWQLDEDGKFWFLIDERGGDDGEGYESHVAILMLDPDFWAAVGRARHIEDGQGHVVLRSPTGVALDDDIGYAEYTMHRFIRYMCEEKHINNAIGRLFPELYVSDCDFECEDGMVETLDSEGRPSGYYKPCPDHGSEPDRDDEE